MRVMCKTVKTSFYHFIKSCIIFFLTITYNCTSHIHTCLVKYLKTIRKYKWKSYVMIFFLKNYIMNSWLPDKKDIYSLYIWKHELLCVWESFYKDNTLKIIIIIIFIQPENENWVQNPTWIKFPESVYYISNFAHSLYMA